MSHYLETRIKIRHLRVVDALDRHKSLLKASRALNVTQPALTRTLQEIEEIVGEELFERHPRGVRPNARGAVLVEAAHAVLGQLRRAQDSLEGLAQNNSNTTTVGALPVAASGLLPAVLSGLYRSGSELHVRLLHGRTDELLPRLASGEIDVVIGRLYPQLEGDGFHRRIMYVDPIALIARADHAIFAKACPQPEHVNRYRLILPTLSQHVERDITAVIETLGLSPREYLRATSTSFVRELLLSTDCVTIMPGMLLAGDIGRGELRALPLQDAAQARPGGIILKNEAAAHRPATARLLSELSLQLARMVDKNIICMPQAHNAPG